MIEDSAKKYAKTTQIEPFLRIVESTKSKSLGSFSLGPGELPVNVIAINQNFQKWSFFAAFWLLKNCKKLDRDIYFLLPMSKKNLNGYLLLNWLNYVVTH